MSQDWPGFHGLDRQGVASEPSLPVDWSQIDANWKTPVPGFGYSSPVVAGDKIYLTTAYEIQKGKSLRRWLAYSNQALSWLLVAIASIVAIGVTPSSGFERRKSLLNGYWGFLIMSAALFVPGIVTFGEGLLNLEFSTLRSWKIGTVMASVAFFLIPLLMPWSKVASVVFAILATLLSAFAYLFFPLRDIFEDSRISGAIICTCVFLLPGLLGWATFVGLRCTKKAPTGNAFSPAPAQYLPIALNFGLAAFFTIGAFWVLKLRMERKTEPVPWNGNPPGELPLNIQFDPAFGWPFTVAMGFLALLAIVLGSALIWKRPQSLSWVALCGVSASAVLGLGCFLRFSVFPLKREMAHVVVCVDAGTGAVRWLRQVGYNSTITDFKGLNSHATPTVTVGTDALCTYFGASGLYGISPMGKVSWKVIDAEFNSLYGIGHSPVVCDDIIILANDNERPPDDTASGSHIVAYSLKDGRLLWRQGRNPSRPRSAGFSTPIVRTIRGKKTILMRGWDDLTAYDLYTGQIHWSWDLKHRSSLLVASLVSDDKHVYVLDGAGLRALDLDALAERREPVAWVVPAPGEKIASPVLVDKLLYFATDTGMAFCVDTNGRNVVWKEKLGGRFFSSAVAHGNSVIFADESGKISVVARDRKFNLIKQIEMGEKIYATPVPRADGLLVRGATNLFCLKVPQSVIRSEITDPPESD